MNQAQVLFPHQTHDIVSNFCRDNLKNGLNVAVYAYNTAAIARRGLFSSHTTLFTLAAAKFLTARENERLSEFN